jgi:hypothetical protein
MSMSLKEKALCHQIHPPKLATGIGVSVGKSLIDATGIR